MRGALLDQRPFTVYVRQASQSWHRCATRPSLIHSYTFILPVVFFDAEFRAFPSVFFDGRRELPTGVVFSGSMACTSTVFYGEVTEPLEVTETNSKILKTLQRPALPLTCLNYT